MLLTVLATDGNLLVEAPGPGIFLCLPEVNSTAIFCQRPLGPLLPNPREADLSVVCGPQLPYAALSSKYVFFIGAELPRHAVKPGDVLVGISPEYRGRRGGFRIYTWRNTTFFVADLPPEDFLEALASGEWGGTTGLIVSTPGKYPLKCNSSAIFFGPEDRLFSPEPLGKWPSSCRPFRMEVVVQQGGIFTIKVNGNQSSRVKVSPESLPANLSFALPDLPPGTYLITLEGREVLASCVLRVPVLEVQAISASPPYYEFYLTVDGRPAEGEVLVKTSGRNFSVPVKNGRFSFLGSFESANVSFAGQEVPLPLERPSGIPLFLLAAAVLLPLTFGFIRLMRRRADALKLLAGREPKGSPPSEKDLRRALRGLPTSFTADELAVRLRTSPYFVEEALKQRAKVYRGYWTMRGDPREKALRRLREEVEAVSGKKVEVVSDEEEKQRFLSENLKLPFLLGKKMLLTEEELFYFF